MTLKVTLVVLKEAVSKAIQKPILSDLEIRILVALAIILIHIIHRSPVKRIYLAILDVLQDVYVVKAVKRYRSLPSLVVP